MIKWIKKKNLKQAKYCSDNNAENWEKFLNGNIIVNLSTVKEYNKFLKECENKNANLRWRSGDRLTVINFWENYKKDFCVRVNLDKKTLSFGSKALYDEQGYNIINYKDFEHEKENI